MARKVNFLGGLAQAKAGDANPMWGALAAGAIGTGTAIGVRTFTGMDKNAELIGLGAGAATGLALMMSPRTRAAGFTGLLTALMTNGLRYAEAMLSPKQQIKDIAGVGVTFNATTAATRLTAAQQLTAAKTAAANAGFGMRSSDYRTALGARSAEERTALLGARSAEDRTVLSGLGIVSPEVLRTLGASGASPMPTFEGENAPVQIVGATGLGSHFGATLFG
jgi:hypothetical protein